VTSDIDARYDAIWDDGWPRVAAGDVELDTRLPHGPDTRRGITLIARPGPALTASFDALLHRLDALAPGQYRQPRADLHVTILSLSSASDDHRVLTRLPEFHAAARAALAGTGPLAIDFRGVCVSRGAVLAQGYPVGGALEALRARLRTQLRARGLDAMLDSRYRIVTAHATLLRFVRPLDDPAAFAAALAALRRAPLGVLHADALELVVNDWYMSSATLRLVERIALDA